MSRARKALLVILVVLLLPVLATVGWVYWRLWGALPDYQGELRLDGLKAPVRVLRDARGIPHVYAESLDDLIFAQGYLTAEERLFQMDALRRTSRGEVAELFGRNFLELDKDARRLGLADAAERAVGSLDSESREQLETYARGINAYLEARRHRLPLEFVFLRYQPRPWSAADSIAVALNMYRLLSTSWPDELRRARVTQKLGPELARDLYVSHSPLDRPVAEAGPQPRRPERRRVYVAGCAHRPSELPAGSELAAAGSNNWVVAGARTASGKPLLANDPHLPHMLPAIWFAIHLKSPELNVAGVSLPGVPFVILGHNGRIAWGMTNLAPDVQDLYRERFHPDDRNRYLTPGGWQTVGRRLETIRVRGEPDVEIEVLRTRHGPIVHDDGTEKLALRWTALETELLTFPFYDINRAQNWDELRAALALFSGPAQNFVYADVDGNIGYYGAGRVPIRRRGSGELPVPGETSDHDWVGTIPFPEMPQAFNPPMGILATANNRVVPDGYPHHLTDRWEPPYRAARIYEILEEQSGFKPGDFLRHQGDISSHPDFVLAQQLAAAARNVAELAEAADILRSWDGQMRATDAAPLLTTTAQRVLLEQLLRPKLGDDWTAYTWRLNPVFLENVLRDRPARWLPAKRPDGKGFADYDELLRATLRETLRQLTAEFRLSARDGRPRPGTLGALKWGEHLRVEFVHPASRVLPRFAARWLNVGVPQSGGRYAVKQMTRQLGPSLRLVVDLANFDNSLLNIPLGQSGHLLSPYYRDQFAAWDAVQSFPFPFSDAAVEKTARHRLRLVPRR